MNEAPSDYADVEPCTEETLRKVGKRIALGTPLGLAVKGSGHYLLTVSVGGTICQEEALGCSLLAQQRLDQVFRLHQPCS